MGNITYGSVCSGIEAATVAWEPLGWRAGWYAEIEPFPCAVLAHHYPDTPNHGDMTRLAAMVLSGKIQAPEVLVGGTPCQAFSVAGMREGLADPRGALTIKYVELLDAIDHVRTKRGQPEATCLWENVPGVLSDKGNAFGCFLGALAGEDCELQPSGKRWTDAGCVFGPKRTVAWRILDAQYFGLAQRRRRVFVVASARAGFDPLEVLFEREGVRRDTPPRRGEGQDVACTLDARTEGGGFPGTDGATGGHVVAPPAWPLGFDVTGPVTACGGTEKKHGFGWGQQEWENGFCIPVSVHGTQDPDVLNDQAHPLGRNHGQENAVLAFSCKDYGADATNNLSPTLRAMGHGESHANAGGQVTAAFAIQSGALRTNPASGPDGVGVQADHAYTLEARAEVQAVFVTGDITHTLKAEGFDASEDGTGRGQPIINHQERSDACAQEAYAIAALRELRKSAGEKAFAQWGSGVLDSLQSEEVLQSWLYGQGLREQACHFKSILDDGSLPCPKNLSDGAMHLLWEGGPDGCTSQGRQLAKQLARELGKAVPELPLEGTQVQSGATVRRLTPVECERLMGFPDNHTRITYRGKPADECPDGPRYKAIGNSKAVFVVRWIGQRIQQQLERIA